MSKSVFIRSIFGAAFLSLAGCAAIASPPTMPVPMVDGHCTHYAPKTRTDVADGVALFIRQDKDYVWLCITLPEGSFGVADVHLDAPNLSQPLNLHVSAQLGEWNANDPDGAPDTSDSAEWWNNKGWIANWVHFNGMRESDSGRRPNFRHSPGREFQLSKDRFGRGSWKMLFKLVSVANPAGGMQSITYPDGSDEDQYFKLVAE
jgi:hypothetical protein